MSSGGMAKTSACPAPADWLTPALLERVERLTLHDLVVVTGTLQKEGHGNISLMVTCSRCGKQKKKWLMNLEKAKGVRCGCHRATDPIRYTLAIRYNAMNQRCNTDTHVSSHNYKGRGIKLEFESREDFIQWALATWPSETFKGKDFDRIDNDGNYSKANLRLVSRAENLRNTRISKNSSRVRAEQFMRDHPDVKFSYHTIWNFLRKKFTPEEICKHYAKNPTLAAAHYETHGYTARAKKFVQDHPDLDYTWKTVYKFLQRGQNEAWVLEHWTENKEFREKCREGARKAMKQAKKPESPQD